MKFSVLMPVYHRESPDYLQQSLASLAIQTLPADEIVLVEDGPLGEPLDAVIAAYRRLLPIVSVPLPEHVGLGAALRAGLDRCRGEYVARMDADDICVPVRFERQVQFLDDHWEVDVLGSAIEEFDVDLSGGRSIRRLPRSSPELIRFARFRNPLNHMTAMLRKVSVLSAGSYQSYPGFEDYHLWARMLGLGYCLHNLEEILVQARCGKRMQNRRGGLAYMKREMAFQLFLHEVGLVAASECVRNILMRAPIRLAPNAVRSICYKLFLRHSPAPAEALHHGS